ncbi:MAG TPA: hypothetical protein PKA64_11395, partial [Myxococcota bacterium]|nr:hypothetical protein [Myxococcota bacterium]
ALDGRVGEVEDRTAELQAAYDRLAADHAALEAAHAQLQADYAALEARVAEVEDSAVWYIGESVTYDIPGDFGSLDEAMSWLARYRISTDAIVTLQLGPGTHTMTETLVVQHPNAQNIEIVGNVAAPASVVLEAAPGSAAEGGLIHAGHGVYLGAVRGLTLASSNTGAGNAMLAFENGGIGVAEKVRVEGFVYGAQATTSGTIVAPGIVTDGTGYGLLASHGGYLRADDARVVMAGTDVGVGLYAVDGGVLVSIGGRSTNGQYGALATRNSLVHADDAIFTAPSKFGVYAQYGSHVRVDGATVTGMGSDSTYGYLAQFNASVSAGSSTLSSPVTWGYRAAYTSSIAAAYAIANRADVYNTFAADYGSSVYVPYATGRATHLGYYAQASSINAFNSSSSGGDYGYYAYGNAFLEASDSVASGAGSYGFYSGYSSIVDRSGGSGTALPAAASTAGANSNNFYSYVR